jgi:N-acylneuraminate cytidylyltransferase
VDAVFVSTDDAEITAISQNFGAEVIQRPDSISGDMASSEEALIHAIDEIRSRQGCLPELVVFLQCTSPLTCSEDIESTIQTLKRENADSALTVSSFHYFLWKDDPVHGATGINHDKSVRQLRQQREPEFIENGAVYVMRTSGFLDAQHRFFGKTVTHTVPAERRWEIDEPVDFEIAEMLLERQKSNRNQKKVPQYIQAVVFDFDGVFTDNCGLVDQNGVESVRCNRGDGMGISQLKRLGVRMLVLSSEENPVVAQRCKKLKLECMFGVEAKLERLNAWMAEHNLKSENLIFVGNDINDVDCLSHVGCGIAVSDAHPEALKVADMVLQNRGGDGAVRELTDLLLEHASSFQPTLEAKNPDLMDKR